MKSGERLRVARRSAGLKQKELAEICGLSPEYICRVEAGKQEPRRHTMTLLLMACRQNAKEQG